MTGGRATRRSGRNEPARTPPDHRRGRDRGALRVDGPRDFLRADRGQIRLLVRGATLRRCLADSHGPSIRLDEHYGPSWLTRETAYGSEEARRALRDEASRELSVDVVSWIVYWSSFVAVLLWFIHSVHTYFLRLYEPAGTGPRRLASPLLAQLVIGVLGVVPLFLDRVEFWPGTLLIPVVIVTFLVEGWARYRRRRIA